VRVVLIAGSFGQLDPASAALQDYLMRIQQQAHQVHLPYPESRNMPSLIAAKAFGHQPE